MLKDPKKVAQGKNNKRKGNKNELKSKKMLESLGYDVCKAGGSLGLWDLVAVNTVETLLVQVKSNRWPPPVEREMMELSSYHDRTRKIIHRWNDYAREPITMEVK